MTDEPKPPKRPAAKRKPAAKKPAARKPAAKTPARRQRKKPPVRMPWEPATAEDMAAVEKELDKAALAKERAEPLTARDRANRDGAIVAAVIGRGMRVVTVAEQVGLSEEQVRRILKTYRDSRLRQAFPDSMSLLFDALDALESNIEEAAQLATASAEKHPGVQLGAMRLRRDLQVDRLQVLIHMGIVRPDAHSQVRSAEFRRRLQIGLEALRAAGVSDKQLAAMREAMEGAATGGEVITIGEARGA